MQLLKIRRKSETGKELRKGKYRAYQHLVDFSKEDKPTKETRKKTSQKLRSRPELNDVNPKG